MSDNQTHDNEWHMDKRVNVGHLIMTATLLIGGFTVVNKLDTRITANETRLALMEQHRIEYQRDLNAALVRIETKIDRVIERENER